MCPLRSRHLVLLAALLLFACGQPESSRAVAPPEAGKRVILTTKNEWPSDAQVADRAAQLGGVRVRDAMELGPRRYRLTLLCVDEAACKDAMARIAADRFFVHAVEPADPREKIPAKPTRETSR
jgi:hypothetical protein